jgi:hypothetical protein
MNYREKTDYSYALQDMLRRLLMDIALVIIYGMLLIVNTIRRLRDGSKHEQ